MPAISVEEAKQNLQAILEKEEKWYRLLLDRHDIKSNGLHQEHFSGF
ncbi:MULTISPECIES: hypothetical protein [unclassified Microcoleus]